MVEENQQVNNSLPATVFRLLPGPKTVITFLLGALFWRVYSYWRRLLGRPSLVSLPLLERLGGQIIDEEKAVLIATADLRAGLERRYLPNGQRKLVLCAGLRNFREPWARDFGFAGFGLAELNEVQAIKETLEVFLINQTTEGQFPVKVHSTGIIDRYLHSLFGKQQPIYAPIRPKYLTAHDTISLDGNALLVIAGLNYLRRFDDEKFSDTHWHSLKQALRWLETQASEEHGLLHQGAFTDWADSIARWGAIHYTNVLHWKAVHDFAEDAAKYGYQEDYEYFSAKEIRLREAINHHFWREDLGYYVTSSQFDLLSSDGNLLAVAWGLASKKQANAILDAMKGYGMAVPVPTQVTNRPYGTKYVALENRLAGIGHYHTSAAWLWLGAWHVIALSRVGRIEEARQLLERIEQLIVRDEVVHEVYDKNGKYLSTFWYTSEAPLTWSAGMIVHAQAVYQRALTNV